VAKCGVPAALTAMKRSQQHGVAARVKKCGSMVVRHVAAGWHAPGMAARVAGMLVTMVEEKRKA